VIFIDPDALGRLDAGWWPGGDSVFVNPTSPRLSPVVETTGLARVAHVSDETDLTGVGDGPDRQPDDQQDDEMTADQAAEIEAAMAEARARLADVPAEVVVTNHVMGLYELGAIHLSSDTPDLVSASLAIDAMGMLVDGLGERLGDDTATMRDALANIKMAFVRVKAQTGQAGRDDD
jgi:hypothetical protein